MCQPSLIVTHGKVWTVCMILGIDKFEPELEGIMPKGPIYHALAWRVGPFWQDTIEFTPIYDYLHQDGYHWFCHTIYNFSNAFPDKKTYVLLYKFHLKLASWVLLYSKSAYQHMQFWDTKFRSTTAAVSPECDNYNVFRRIINSSWFILFSGYPMANIVPLEPLPSFPRALSHSDVYSKHVARWGVYHKMQMCELDGDKNMAI